MKSDGLPLDDLAEVDWDKLTEQQAANFAFTLEGFNDAVEAARQVKTALYARIASLVTVALVGSCVASSWDNPWVVVSATSTALGLSGVVTWWALRKRNKAVDDAVENLKRNAAKHFG